MKDALEGLSGVEAVLRDLPSNIAKGAIRRVLRRAAEPIRDRWRENARFLTGRFKGSIETSSQAASGKSGPAFRSRRREAGDEALVYVGPTKEGYPQAIFEEVGTIHQPAQAPGRRAWESEKENALAIAVRELGPEVAKTAARLAKKLARK